MLRARSLSASPSALEKGVDMPGLMFQEVVCPKGATNRKWYALPVSFAAHTIVIGILVVVPLVATDVLPQPRAILEYLVPAMPATIVAQPPRLQSPQLQRDVRTAPGIPLEAPPGITPETGVSIEREPVIGVEGVIEGLGGDHTIIET